MPGEEDAASTATLEDTDTKVEEPQVAADFEEPKEEPEPAKIEVVEEKSASDRYLDDWMALPSDERTAMFSKAEQRMEEAGDAVPWKERQDADTAARADAASQLREREQREQSERSLKITADAAYKNIKQSYRSQHDLWEKRGIDDPTPQHDDAELDQNLAEYVSSESRLMSHDAIVSIGNAMNDILNEHGGLTEEEVRRLRTIQDRPAITKFLMEAFGDRVKEKVTVELNKDITKRIEDAVMAETAAIKAEAMREVEVAPEQVQTAAAGTKAPTYAEYNDATFAERAEWKEKGVEPVAAE